MERTLRILSVLFALILCTATFASADPFDLSGLSYDELVTLKNQINLAMWNSQEWQKVTVPQGVWKVGEDIPAGHWTITAAGGWFAFVEVGTELDETGKGLSFDGYYVSDRAAYIYSEYYDPMTEKLEIDFELKDGMYVVISYASAIFSPYAGKPSLGFK